jgi:hypothetical protein
LYAENCSFDVVDDTAYIGSFYNGILFLPLNGGLPTWLRHTEGGSQGTQLPSNRVLALTVQANKLFASMGAFSGQGSFLVSVDLADRSVHTLSSSRGNAQDTALDDLEQPPLVFLPMVNDPARHRVLFAVSHPLSHTGLWAIDSRDGTLRRLTVLGRYIHWISDARAGRVMLGLSNENCSQWQAVEFDLSDNSQKVVYSSIRERASDGLEPSDDAWIAPDWLAQPPYLRVGDSLWTGWPFGRLTHDGRLGESYPLLEDRPDMLRELWGLNHEFNWRGMELLADGRILVSDRHGIWLVENAR